MKRFVPLFVALMFFISAAGCDNSGGSSPAATTPSGEAPTTPATAKPAVGKGGRPTPSDPANPNGPKHDR